MAFVPIGLSLLLLAAHFLRGGTVLFVVGVLVLLALLPIRRRWVARLVQAALALGALEWIRTLVRLAMWRSEQGEPFLRMALILGAVATLTLISVLLFETERLRRFYGLGGDGA